MDNGRTTSDDDAAHGARVLPAAMIACTFLGLLVAIGLMLRTNLNAAQSRPAAVVTSNVTSVPVRAAPVYQVGGDCSAGGISAQWESTDGQLNCVARDRVRDAHRPGDDCSHDGVTASWQFLADRWICVPQAAAPAPAPAPAPGTEPEAPVPPPAPAPEEYVPAPVEQPYIPPATSAPGRVYQPTEEPPAPEPAPAPAPAPAQAPAPPPPPAWLPQLPPLPWLPPPGR